MVPSHIIAPRPAARPPLHASSYDKAERASSDFSSKDHQDSLKSCISGETCTGGISLEPKPENILSCIQPQTLWLWEHLASCLLWPIRRAFSWYRSYLQVKTEEKERLRTLYADVKTMNDLSVESYPEGWPQLAAFQHSNDNFAIFRRFGLAHCPLLVQLEAEIALLEQQLYNLDREDAIVGAQHAWRLRTAEFKVGWDPGQRDILKQLQEKVLVYDSLLSNDRRLRSMGKASADDYRSVLHWIMGHKPLGPGQYEWLHQSDDFVQLSNIDCFQSSVLSSFLKKLFRIHEPQQGTSSQVIHQYSVSTLAAIAKLLTVLLTVSILIIPVFLLLWIPMTRGWISATVLISVLVFSSLMSLLTKAEVQGVLVRTAAYCAVLATFLGNTHPNVSGQGNN